jgi:acylphosphatase
MMELHCFVTGRVQGVYYRSYLEEAATRLGLVGFVRNCPNGAVEICAQGEIARLKEFMEHVHEGSLQSRVEGVDASWRAPSATYFGFSVLH